MSLTRSVLAAREPATPVEPLAPTQLGIAALITLSEAAAVHQPPHQAAQAAQAVLAAQVIPAAQAAAVPMQIMAGDPVVVAVVPAE
jgi:hypothetical protein